MTDTSALNKITSSDAFINKTMAVSSIVDNLATGIGNGLIGNYSAKASYYQQKAELNSQAIPLYQQISAKTQQLQNQQALAYLNSGVDITQGTARYVLNHTMEQGLMKMNERQCKHPRMQGDFPAVKQANPSYQE